MSGNEYTLARSSSDPVVARYRGVTMTEGQFKIHAHAPTIAVECENASADLDLVDANRALMYLTWLRSQGMQIELKHAGPHYKRLLISAHKAVKATGNSDALAAVVALGRALGHDLEPVEDDAQPEDTGGSDQGKTLADQLRQFHNDSAAVAQLSSAT